MIIDATKMSIINAGYYVDGKRILNMVDSPEYKSF